MPALQFRKTETGKISRERTESRRIWRSHLLGSWFDKDWRQNLWISDRFGWCDIPFNGLSMSEYLSIRSHFQNSWKDGHCPDEPEGDLCTYGFPSSSDMHALYRMQNLKRFPTGPYTPWPNRAEMGVRLFKKFLSALVDTASKKSGPDHSVTDHTCPVDTHGSDGDTHTGNPE